MKDGQTIGQWLNWDFKTNVVLEIKDKNGNRIYAEASTGYWAKYEFDSKGNLIYYEVSTGFWAKYEYDSQGNQIYVEASTGFWAKYEFDSKNNQIYVENSNGEINDNRTPEIIEHNGRKYQLIP
jgi:glucose dehydrogenase